MFNSKVPFGIKVTMAMFYFNFLLFAFNGYNGLVDQNARTDSWMRIMLFSGIGMVASGSQAETKLNKIGMSFDDL